MRIATFTAAAVIAMAASIGLASAADKLITLNGIKAFPMSTAELSAVRGMDHHFTLTNDGQGVAARHNTDQHQDALETDPVAEGKPGNFMTIEFPQFNADGTPQIDPATGLQVVTIRAAAPSYNGLKNACANSLTNGGSISGPGFLC